MKQPFLMTSVALVLALTACGGQLDQTMISSADSPHSVVTASPEMTASSASSASEVLLETAQPVATGVTPSVVSSVVQEETSAPATSSSAELKEQCGSKSAEQAVAENVGKVPEYAPGFINTPMNDYPNSSWSSEIEASDYDPCADLSWVLVHTMGGTIGSPYQIMLFHKDQYIGTPAKVAFVMNPAVKRLADDKIEVGYRWAEGNEVLGQAQVRAISTFTYNPSTGGVDHSGQWPKSDIIRADGTLPIDDVLDRGVAQRAGGDIPADSVEHSSFQTPSGNIKCVLSGSDPKCWEISNEQTISLGGENDLPEVTDELIGISNGDLFTADYGSTVYSGSHACAIEDNGVTCWNNLDGHGAFISKQDTFTF